MNFCGKLFDRNDHAIFVSLSLFLFSEDDAFRLLSSLKVVEIMKVVEITKLFRNWEPTDKNSENVSHVHTLNIVLERKVLLFSIINLADLKKYLKESK